MAEFQGQHCQADIDEQGVARLALDVAAWPTNALSLDVLEDWHLALDEIGRRQPSKGLVIRSLKPAGFAVGLDADTLGRLADIGHARELAARGQALTARIADWPAPTVAAVHGNCHAGGLEIALAARYRVAAGDATTKIGLPEVHLGMHPFFGGTARLSDRVGMTPAFDLMTTGRMVGAGEALQMGLVDATGTADGLDEAACDLIARDPGPGRPRARNRLLSLKPVRWLREMIRLADDEGAVIPASHPATTALRRLFREHAGDSVEARVTAERASFLRLLEQATTLNFIRVFLLQNRLRSAAPEEPEIAPGCRIHVVGAGAIGSNVAAQLALHGFAVSLEDHAASALEAGRSRVHRLLRDHCDGEAAFTAARDRIIWSPDADAIGDCPVAIEAVEEDDSVKHGVHAGLEALLAGDGLIATTTSTLSVEGLARRLDRPERLVGLHFQRAITTGGLSGLVEVVTGDWTSPATGARATALLAALNRTPLPVRDFPGFLVTRLLMPYVLEGARRYDRPGREVIDGAARYMGMAAGPLELADWLGLDHCAELIRSLAGADDTDLPPALLEQIRSGRLGQAVGNGFHDWRGDRRVVSAMPPGHAPFAELGPGLIEPIVTAAERCREEGLVEDEEFIDAGAVLGAGFPAHTGGPLHFRRQRGTSIDAATASGGTIRRRLGGGR